MAACNGIGVISLIAVFFQRQYLFSVEYGKNQNDNSLSSLEDCTPRESGFYIARD